MDGELPQPDFRSQAFRKSAYVQYGEMCRQNPVFHAIDVDGYPTWFILRYNDAKAVLLDDHRFVKDPHNALTPQQLAKAPLPPDINGLISNHMLAKDQPDHTRLRSLVNKAFTQRTIAAFETRVQIVANELIDTVETSGEADLIRAFAHPLPIRIIAELLGVPPEDYEQFHLWSTAVVTLPITKEEGQQFATRLQELIQYLGALFAKRQATPQNDVISELIQAEENGERLSQQELFSMVILLIVAGHETTVNLIGNGTFALLQHPNALAFLKANPKQIPDAIEEMVRYDGPVERATHRWTAEDVLVGAQKIPQGERVIVVLGAANRDPEAFSNPNEFDIHRQDNRHLGFGHGIHYCLGAWLGKMEGRIAFETLLQRLPGLEHNGSPNDLTWSRNVMLRGLEHLPIRWDTT